MRASIPKQSIIFIRELAKRGCRFAWLVSLAGLHRLYAWGILIPHLRRKGGLGKHITMKSSFNSIIVFDHKVLYKIALGKRTMVEVEYGNFKGIQRQFPALLEILPDYKINKNAFASCLSMACFNPVEPEDKVNYGLRIYQLMRSYGSQEQLETLHESKELQAGLGLIAKAYGDSVGLRIRQIVSTFLSSGKYHVGFAHGDFHSRNIMAGDNGVPRLIDLDCVRFHGIQEFDALCFVLEAEWSESGRPWHETIVNYLKGNIAASSRAMFKQFGVEYSRSLAISYIFDRMGQEYVKYGFLLPRKQLDLIVDQILELERVEMEVQNL